MIKPILGTLIAVGGFVLALDYALALPTVYSSYATKSCVEVEAYPGLVFDNTGYTCSNLPSKYDHYWVK